MNWGGFSAQHTLRLIEEVPGLKLVFDTGNPIFQIDRSQDQPGQWQDAFAFWQAVRDHVVHIHIKDCKCPVAEGVEPEYTWPGFIIVLLGIPLYYLALGRGTAATKN